MIKFVSGSIDCTLHQDLCSKFNIHQYPTTILYNQSEPHEYFGSHSAAEIVAFVGDTLNPVGKFGNLKFAFHFSAKSIENQF